MEPPSPSLFRLDRKRTSLSSGLEQRPVLYGYVDAPLLDRADQVASSSLLEYWYILFRRKSTLFRFALLGLLAAALISLVQTPIYRARTSLEIQDFNENFLELKNVDPTTASAGSSTTAESYFQTQVKILESDSLLERVVDKLNRREPPSGTIGGLPLPDWRKILGLRRPAPLLEKEQLIRKAASNLSVRPSGQTRIVEVLYQSTDPQLAADFANTLVSEFIEQSQEMRWKSAQRTGEWLTSHLGEMKAKLEAAEAQLQAYARGSGLMFTSEKENIAETKLRELQDELSKAQAERVAKQAKFEQTKNTPAESLPETLDDPTLREYRLKLTELQRQLVELSAALTPAHYKVQRVQAQISELQSTLAKERENILKRIGNEYEAARRRENLLSRAYDAQSKVVAEQSGKTIHYNTLKHEVDSNRQLYEALLQKVKQASLASAMRASNVLVVDPAKPPFFPYKPNLLLNSALGLFGGMFLGLGFVVLRERLDRRIEAPGDAQIYLNLPELGVIPLAEIPPSRQISSKRPTLPTVLALPGWGTAGQSNADPKASTELSDCLELATWNRRPSLLAESFRATLTSILLPGQNGDYPQVVVVTSPSPGEGKTTVASNLSIAVAEIGRKILLIDGDLRHPRLHKVFGVSNWEGLRDVLWADSPVDSLPIANLVCETKVPGLYLLPSGTRTSKIAGLFYSSRMSRLLERTRREFDMVLIDAPPMIHLADARVLGRLADGIILVFRAGRTTRESALFASQRFVGDGTNILGTILNSWDPSKSPGYGYAYGYEDYANYLPPSGK